MLVITYLQVTLNIIESMMYLNHFSIISCKLPISSSTCRDVYVVNSETINSFTQSMVTITDGEVDKNKINILQGSCKLNNGKYTGKRKYLSAIEGCENKG